MNGRKIQKNVSIVNVCSSETTIQNDTGPTMETAKGFAIQ